MGPVPFIRNSKKRPLTPNTCIIISKSVLRDGMRCAPISPEERTARKVPAAAPPGGQAGNRPLQTKGAARSSKPSERPDYGADRYGGEPGYDSSNPPSR